MKIEDIEKMWEEDCEIDSVDLASAALEIPKLHNKYLKIYNAVRLKILSLKDKHSDLIKIKNEYYSGKLSKEELDEYGWEPFQYKVLRQDLKTYTESDQDLKKIRTRIEYFDIVLEYLKSIIEQINKRNFSIKAAIDWKRFTAGEM